MLSCPILNWLLTLVFLIIVVSFFSLSSITAELYAPKRVFEYGLDFGAGVSNNYFTAAEFLVEDLVIDLKKINSEMPKDGLTIDYEVDAENYFSLNLNESFRLKVFFGLEGSGYANVSKDLFKLLGEGYKVGTTEKIEVNSYGDLFFNTGFKYKTKVKNYGIYITPTYYIPLVFMADTHGKVTYSSSLSGKLQANAEIPLTLYSVIDLEDIELIQAETQIKNFYPYRKAIEYLLLDVRNSMKGANVDPLMIIQKLDFLNECIAKFETAINWCDEERFYPVQNMYNECKKRLEERTTVAHNLEEFEKQINERQGFIKTMWCGDTACEEKIKELTAAKSRCMPFKQENLGDTCVCCGKKADKMVVWGRQY